MKTKLMMTAAALALAACGGSADKSGGNGSLAATGGDAGSAAATGGAGRAGGGENGVGVNLQPGEWEMKMEVVDVVAEGLPPGMAETMKKSASTTNRTCMTEEEAKGPKGDMFSGQKGGSCKSEGFRWAGGRIEGKTTCPGQAGTGETVMTMSGQYSPQSIDMKMSTKTDLMGKPLTMEMRVSGKRVGECSAATKAAG
ncbi:MAG TPA: DUF3617 domain-containing protein [Allosphingosinicella sp.]|jgi:hypothetical protein|nr:DUF3617 domain-containing protein [Allosphingosinicella sp.]